MEKSNLKRSFQAAINGFLSNIKSERNLKIHIATFGLVCLSGFYFQITKMEWLVILLISGLVISLEIINSSIEKLCDFVEIKQNEKIKIIKDTAAAAVLVAAAFAFLIGVFIFTPYLRLFINF